MYVEIGLRGDEGTAAAALGRDRAHVFVGPRGVAWIINRRGRRVRLPRYGGSWRAFRASA
jgi:hypothetical protein